MVFRAVVFKLLVWCGAEGYVSGLQGAAGVIFVTINVTCGNKMPTRCNGGFNYSSSSSIGTATLVGFGLLNYR